MRYRSHDWSATMGEYGFFRQVRVGRQGRGGVLYAKE